MRAFSAPVKASGPWGGGAPGSAAIALAALVLAAPMAAASQALAVLPPPAADCAPFEILDFGTWFGSGLRGRVVAETGDGLSPLESARVLATRDDEVVEVVIPDDDRFFDFGSLPAGSYEVSTCRDGYDELRFLLVVEPSREVRQMLLVLGPSEAGGWRGLVSLPSDPSACGSDVPLVGDLGDLPAQEELQGAVTSLLRAHCECDVVAAAIDESRSLGGGDCLGALEVAEWRREGGEVVAIHVVPAGRDPSDYANRLVSFASFHQGLWQLSDLAALEPGLHPR